MADIDDYVSDEGEQVNFAEDFPVFEIPIYPAGDNAGLHLQNDTNDKWQREFVIQRKGRVDIRCEHKGIVHGYFSDSCNDLYSLIVLQFRFDPNGIAARIKEVHITIKFSAEKPGDRDPVVEKVFPDGLYHVEPTHQHEQMVTAGAINAKVGIPEIGGELKREITVDRDQTDSTMIRGSMDVLERNHPPPNGVSWSFWENATAKTGIICSMRGAILLKRNSMKPFKATVTLDATADTHTRITSIFKKDPKDDDIWYNPKKEPSPKLKGCADKLGTVDLAGFCDVTFRYLLQHTVKGI